ncbi:MAG: kinesin-like protein Klp8 [Trizodia sp. TS-e1964]|nr:MAG: kinesin-like protein Klp8 [Trizodia sp. TS-e1964]
MPPSGGGNIKVVVRVRPFNGRELDRGAKCIVQMKECQTILTPPTEAEERLRGKGSKESAQKVFAFDKSYWSFNRKDSNFAGQDDLFNDLGKPLLDNAFQGYNNCIFAYGQTGSGKSYSMMGYGNEAGVIPKICQDMFERITQLQVDVNLKCTIEVSYLEIYNERVRDLLNPSTKGNLKVREHPSTGPYVEDLAKLVVRSFNEIENLMDEGNKARTVAATNMNETSSRSHAVFTLTLTQKRHDAETNLNTEKVAKISLVDLAGSERATSTGATGARLKEGAEINRSLSTLGRVIAALADLSQGKKKSSSMVPYRDSVLTWLLKDSLGGNSMTAMIAAISPADINFEETLSTLRYADSAKRIKNHAVVNEDPNARMIRELKEELAQLRSKLSGSAAIGGPADEQYSPETPLEQQIVSITQADGTIKKVSKAEIAEQLSQSEKLYEDLNQTWEEKLQKTELIHKEREAALEELGISIEKGFVGLHTPKKMPHLVNLSDDPLLAECLVYNIKPGTTTVGNVETATTSEIRLNGTKILHEHCYFENEDGIVTVVPYDGAAVMVNGLRVSEPKRLRSGYRVILGDFHIFRFNHPQEARAERAEHNLLRHSLTCQMGSSGSRVSGHDRSDSKNGSEFGDISRPESPFSYPKSNRDSDWSSARREAANAILGSEQKISGLTDDELDNLFEDVLRVRAVRKGRSESRLDIEDDFDSVTSYSTREKYVPPGTTNASIFDASITIPSTPLHQMGLLGSPDVTLQDLGDHPNQQRGESLRSLEAMETFDLQSDEIPMESNNMEDNIKIAKFNMEKRLQQQFETRLQQALSSQRVANSFSDLSTAEISTAKKVLERWQQWRYVRMAQTILQHAATLKEAQVMSQEMDKNVMFQFTIVDIGHTFASSYDLVLNGISGEEDNFLESAHKPCVAVRILDFKNSVIFLWSLEKLLSRIRLMRQLYQYIDRPEYLQHFNLGNPFSEACLPKYSLIGDADIPLTAVFESRVQDFVLDVISPHTSSVVGILKLSLEPSSAQAPTSTLKFNVVMHDMLGFAEREGTDVHAQLFVPGISDEGGATTTQMICGFDEGTIRFESVHSMSLPLSSPRTSTLRVSVFAKVTNMHLDKLLSWDDIRDSAQPLTRKENISRIPESAFHTEEIHDIFTRVQILELSESGEYLPVEVVQTNALDTGAYQLHQGLQRRILVRMTLNSFNSFAWQEVSSMRIGSIKLLDPSGRTPDLGSSPHEILLKYISPTTIERNSDGTTNVTILGQWDSSLHESLLLDRITMEKYRVQMTLAWNISSARLSKPILFSLNLLAQVLPRFQVRAPSILFQFWTSSRSSRSIVGMFSVALKTAGIRRAEDLWRMTTQYEYVKGEENLTSWVPRGVSLLRDFMNAQKRRRNASETEATRGLLNWRTRNYRRRPLSSDLMPNERQVQLMRRCLQIWCTKDHPINKLLVEENTEPPKYGAAFAADQTNPLSVKLIAEVHQVTKNPTVLKEGYLLAPDNENRKWTRLYIELRRPYIHIYSVPDGDELNAVNLTNSRIDHQPQVSRLLQRSNIFAVYAAQNSFLFASKNQREKLEWILKIDPSYFGRDSYGGENI